MTARLHAAMTLRELRGSAGRLAFFAMCLAVGVTAVISVAGLASGVDDGIRSQARELLAADISVESMRAIPAELDGILAEIPGAERADIREFVSIVAAASGPARGASRLAQLKIAEGGYPFYGKLKTLPPGTLVGLLDEGTVVVAEGLLAALDLAAGDRLRVGVAEFTVAAALVSEPDRLDLGFSSLAPRVFLSPAALERSGLERFGSRIQHRALVKLREGSSAARVREVATRLREELPGSAHLGIETYLEAQPALRGSLERAERFLGLVALLSLLIGGIGVGQTVRAWLASRMDSIAVLKCLGLRPREVLSLYLGQTALLGLIASLAGAAAGTAILAAAPFILEGIVPRELIRVFQPTALLRGLALGVGVAVLFGLPALLSTLRVPPVRVLRHDAEPLRAHLAVRAAALLALLGGIFTTALVQAGSAVVAAWFTAGILALAGLLALAAWLVSRGASRMPRGIGRVWLRHGLAALGRPGAGTIGAIVALGLGVVVVLGMYLVETRVSAQFEKELPEEAPSAFILNIQPDQWEGLRAVLDEEGATRVTSVPLVNARVLSVDGVEVSKLLEREEAEESGRRRRRWVLTREQRLTWMEELPGDNTIVEGALWSEPGVAEVSVEMGFADDMGVKVGSRITLDIQGLPMELAVTSIRTVVWETFGINFFMIVEPGALEGAPWSRVATVRAPAGSEQGIQDRIVAAWPNLTVIPIREVLDRIVEVLRQAGLGVRILGGFTVIAGIFILGGAVSAGSIRRGREVALMKTLGMTRREVAAVYSVEYALVGLTAGLIGVAGAGVMAWAILVKWMEIPANFTPAPFVASAIATVALAVGAGTAASARALARRPIEVLRDA